jgi:hypothetical protein
MKTMRPTLVMLVVAASVVPAGASAQAWPLALRQAVAPLANSAHQARAADGLKVIVVDGAEAANIVAEKIAAEPVIEVRDRDDRRVPNAIVRFLIRKTARNRLAAVFRNGQAEVRTLTDATGRASANALTPLEPGSFQIDVEASYQGQTGKATIHHTNFATSADAKSAGREPGKSTSSNAPTAASGATATTTTATTTTATAATTASTAAVAAGGGMSKLAVVGLALGGAAGAGAAVVLARKESDAPAGTVSAVTPSQTGGVQSASPFTFSVQVTGFDAGSTTYRWEFGDGGTSTEPTPTHVYAAAGTFNVVVTVSDPRQSARSEMSVTVFSVTGTWVTSDGRVTLQLTQADTAMSGVATWENSPDGPWVCALSGSVQAGTPVAILLSQPSCPHHRYANLVEMQYRLGMAVGGQVLSGTLIQGPGRGEFERTSQITLRR